MTHRWLAPAEIFSSFLPWHAERWECSGPNTASPISLLSSLFSLVFLNLSQLSPILPVNLLTDLGLCFCKNGRAGWPYSLWRTVTVLLFCFRLDELISILIQELGKILALNHNFILHVPFPISYSRPCAIQLMKERELEGLETTDHALPYNNYTRKGTSQSTQNTNSRWVLQERIQYLTSSGSRKRRCCTMS